MPEVLLEERVMSVIYGVDGAYVKTLQSTPSEIHES